MQLNTVTSLQSTLIISSSKHLIYDVIIQCGHAKAFIYRDVYYFIVKCFSFFFFISSLYHSYSIPLLSLFFKSCVQVACIIYKFHFRILKRSIIKYLLSKEGIESNMIEDETRFSRNLISLRPQPPPPAHFYGSLSSCFALREAHESNSFPIPAASKLWKAQLCRWFSETTQLRKMEKRET